MTTASTAHDPAGGRALDTVRNGVDTAALFGTLDAVEGAAALARFQFRARNRWIHRGAQTAPRSRTCTAPDRRTPRAPSRSSSTPESRRCYAARTRDQTRRVLLHALAACVTTSLVYSAAARGVRLTRVESTVEGDIDVRGALGLDDSFRNGFERIRMSFSVSGDATPEKLRAVVARGVQRSVVFDSITAGVPVQVDVTAA